MTSRKKAGSSKKPLSDIMQSCHSVLKTLMANQKAGPFLEPVDWEAYGLTDYPEIITHPMDLGTVKKNLDEGKFSTPSEFAAAVRLTWSNAQRYNRSDSDIYSSAQKLSKLFEKSFEKNVSSKSGTKKESKRKDTEVSRADRVAFCEYVRNLSDEQLGMLVVMIQKNCPEALNEEDEHELEIEINNIDVNTFNSCMEFVRDKGNGQASKRRKT